MKYLRSYAALLLLSACGNPGGISDTAYAKYKELGAPKILYSCTEEGSLDAHVAECLNIQDVNVLLACSEEAKSRANKPIVNVGYTAGVGIAATYNKILGEAKNDCRGEFKILDGQQ